MMKTIDKVLEFLFGRHILRMAPAIMLLLFVGAIVLSCTQAPVVQEPTPELISQWSSTEDNIYLNIYEYRGDIYLVFIHKDIFTWEVEIIPLEEWNPHTDGDVEVEWEEVI